MADSASARAVVCCGSRWSKSRRWMSSTCCGAMLSRRCLPASVRVAFLALRSLGSSVISTSPRPTLGGVCEVGEFGEAQRLVRFVGQGYKDPVLNRQQVVGLERALELWHCSKEYDDQTLPCPLLGVGEPAGFCHIFQPSC